MVVEWAGQGHNSTRHTRAAQLEGRTNPPASHLRLVGTGFYTNAAAAFAGNLVGPTNIFLLNDSNNNNVGWTVGGGVEWAFALNWTAKIEGLYVAFERDRLNNNFLGGEVVGVSNTGAAVTAGQLGFENRRNRDDFGVVRVGVNYKFGTY